MTNCVNIIINIKNYRSDIKYTGYVRPVGSIVDFSTYPEFTKVATSQQIIFNKLPPGEYETGLQKSCPDGNVSEIIWKEPASVDCDMPVIEFDGTNFSIIVPDNSTYEWRVDEGDWVEVAADTIPYTLALADIETELDGYIAERPYAIADIQFRTICSSGLKSAIKHYYHVDSVQAMGYVSLIKTICENNIYKGQHLRLTISQDDSGNEVLTYHAPDGDVDISTIVRTGNMDDDIQTYKNLVSGFNAIRKVDPADPETTIAVSIDFITKVSPHVPPFVGDVPCDDYAVEYEIVLPPP